jgi:heme-degrading monooxygenase HmoA
MPVTNLVWLTSSSDTFTAENKAAMEGAFDAQADWVARNVASAPTDREARGVALFQQVEDPRVVMETAHWSSSDEHGAWLASDEYKMSSAPLGAHFDFSKLEYFHLDVDAFRPVDAAAGEESLLRSPVVSVGRAQVPTDKKQELLQAWDGRKKFLEDFAKPGVVRTGFRIQKSDPDTDEFVAFVGWESVEKHGEFGKSPGLTEDAIAWLAITKGVEVKHYKRIL